MDEITLIQDCKNGNINSFGLLYDKYIDEIYKFIYLKTFDKELSEDLTSQTFFKAINGIKKFNTSNSNFRAWLYRIAYNNIVDNSKKIQNSSIEENQDIPLEVNFGDDFDNKELLNEVIKYLNTINKKHKQIIIMRIWDDLSYKEISEITGVSVDNAKKIVSRNLSKLGEINKHLLVFLLIILM